ncbi:MAG: hypothetical protein J3T61_13170, partial [Candidatus Brocadiales bacterium]|nr:hypothetical protein [Candidatus Bathyanammoxibius sp.]
EAHQKIYWTFLHLHERGREINSINVGQFFRFTGVGSECGGLAYISECMEACRGVANIEWYARLVRDLHTQRQFMEECCRQFLEGYEAPEADTYIIEAQEAISKAAQGLTLNQVSTPNDLYEEHGKWLDELIAAKNTSVGLPFGILELDVIVRTGLFDDIVTIAGPTSSGKTSLLFSVAVNLARQGHPGYIASMETSKGKCMRRLNSVVCPPDKFLQLSRAGDFKARHELMRAYKDALRRLPIYIDDSTLYIEDLVFAVKRHMNKYPQTRWIGIDYLQYIQTRARVDEYHKINYILNKVKDMKKIFRIPIFLLSQLNRPDPYNKSKGLGLPDLK